MGYLSLVLNSAGLDRERNRMRWRIVRTGLQRAAAQTIWTSPVIQGLDRWRLMIVAILLGLTGGHD